MKIRLLFLLFSLLFLGKLHAQETTDSNAVTTPVEKKFIYNPDHFIYTDLRYGYTKLGHLFHTGINYKYRYNIFKIGYNHVNNFTSLKDEENQLNDLSVLYGWSFRKKNFLFSASFGVGGIWGNATTNQKDLDTIPLDFNPQIQVKTVSFPIEVMFSFTPPPKLKTFSSIGIVFFGNFNNHKSYLGAGVNLSLGKVSPKLTEQEKKNPLKDYYVPKDRKNKWYD